MTGGRAINGIRFLVGMFALIILTRSSLDPILELTKEGKGIGLGALFNLLVIAGAAPLLVTRFPRLPAGPTLVFVFFLVYIGALTLAAGDIVGGMRNILTLFSFFCWFGLPFVLATYREDVTKVFDAIIASSLFPVLVGLTELISTSISNEGLRVEGTFTHPNIFAFYLLTVVMGILAKQLTLSDDKGKFFFVALLAAYGLAVSLLLVYTKTRSAWIGMTVLIIFFSTFVNKKGFILLALVALVGFLSPVIQDRLSDAASETQYVGEGVIMNSWEWRLALWASAWDWIQDKPFFGHGGFGSFFDLSPSFFSIIATGKNAHNVFVQLAFEFGVPAAILFGCFCAAVALYLFLLRHRDQKFCFLGVAGVIIYLLIALSDNLLSYLTFNWYFWLLLGSVLSWASLPTRNGLANHPLR